MDLSHRNTASENSTTTHNRDSTPTDVTLNTPSVGRPPVASRGCADASPRRALRTSHEEEECEDREAQREHDVLEECAVRLLGAARLPRRARRRSGRAEDEADERGEEGGKVDARGAHLCPGAAEAAAKAAEARTALGLAGGRRGRRRRRRAVARGPRRHGARGRTTRWARAGRAAARGTRAPRRAAAGRRAAAARSSARARARSRAHIRRVGAARQALAAPSARAFSAARRRGRCGSGAASSFCCGLCALAPAAVDGDDVLLAQAALADGAGGGDAQRALDAGPALEVATAAEREGEGRGGSIRGISGGWGWGGRSAIRMDIELLSVRIIFSPSSLTTKISPSMTSRIYNGVA
jgi:hypothetical protein